MKMHKTKLNCKDKFRLQSYNEKNLIPLSVTIRTRKEKINKAKGDTNIINQLNIIDLKHFIQKKQNTFFPSTHRYT